MLLCSLHNKNHLCHLVAKFLTFWGFLFVCFWYPLQQREATNVGDDNKVLTDGAKKMHSGGIETTTFQIWASQPGHLSLSVAPLQNCTILSNTRLIQFYGGWVTYGPSIQTKIGSLGRFLRSLLNETEQKI